MRTHLVLRNVVENGRLLNWTGKMNMGVNSVMDTL